MSGTTYKKKLTMQANYFPVGIYTVGVSAVYKNYSDGFVKMHDNKAEPIKDDSNVNVIINEITHTDTNRVNTDYNSFEKIGDPTDIGTLIDKNGNKVENIHLVNVNVTYTINDPDIWMSSDNYKPTQIKDYTDLDLVMQMRGGNERGGRRRKTKRAVKSRRRRARRRTRRVRKTRR
jgi:hypothetical protein